MVAPASRQVAAWTVSAYLAFGKEWPAGFQVLLGGIYVLGTIRNKQVEMVNTEDSMNIPLVFEEEFIIYKQLSIA